MVFVAARGVWHVCATFKHICRLDGVRCWCAILLRRLVGLVFVGGACARARWVQGGGASDVAMVVGLAAVRSGVVLCGVVWCVPAA